MGRRQWRTPTSLPLIPPWSWRTAFMPPWRRRTTFTASWRNWATFSSVIKNYIIEQQKNFWHHRLKQKYQSDPSSAAINVEACTELPHTLLRIIIVCSLFYHMKKLMSESSYKRTPIGTHHLLTSHPIWWEETEFLNFIRKRMHPI